jgi:hypothetical protein
MTGSSKENGGNGEDSCGDNKGENDCEGCVWSCIDGSVKDKLFNCPPLLLRRRIDSAAWETTDGLLRRLDRSLEIGLRLVGDRERPEACLIVSSSTLSFKRPGREARAGFRCRFGGVITFGVLIKMENRQRVEVPGYNVGRCKKKVTTVVAVG